MGIRICLGKIAVKGYEPEHMGRKLYSVEELCFFLQENAYLLDESFLKEELGSWLEEECELKELGEELKRGAKKKIPLKNWVGILFDYTGFFEPEEVQEILRIIALGEKSSIYEKRKAGADALVKKGYYRAALEKYRDILRILPDQEEQIKGHLLHGCGVCLANMFYYHQAGEVFLKAYEITKRTESYSQYLWTRRLAVNQGEYLDFLREHREVYEESLEMEEILDGLKEKWKESEKSLLLEKIRRKKENYDVAAYQELLKEQVEELKESYLEL